LGWTTPIDSSLRRKLRLDRREFIGTAALAAGALMIGGELDVAAATQSGSKRMLASDLPKGAAPAPVALPHFPDRLHAFVWRNWSLVEVSKLAKVVGAKPSDILRLGKAMGLSDPPRISADQQRRSLLTVIKRNWH